MPRSAAGTIALSVVLDLDGICLGRQSESERQPADVGVHRRPGSSMATLRTTLPVLRPTPGKGHEVLEAVRHLAVEPLDQRLSHPDQALRLVAEEARGPDDLLDVGRVGAAASAAGSGSARTTWA